MSIYGGSSSRKADPRPLTSREFISEQLNELIRYLLENDFNQRISPKLLNPPTGKEFKAVVLHLFRLLDSGYEMTGRVEDEVPLIFKGLRYPFGISKTGLTAVGSPHTWPALLGALSWLVDLLRYDAAVAAAEEGSASADDNDAAAASSSSAAAAAAVPASSAGGDEQAFFSYVRQSYEAFLSGDDGRAEELDEELTAVFEAQQSEIEEEEAAAREETERLRAELEEVRARQKELPAMEAKRADLLSDKGKFETLIGQLHEHKAALQAKLAQREEEADGKAAEQREAEEALAAVRHTIETQELSVDDVQRMDTQRKRHEEKAAANRRQKEEARRELAEAEAVLATAAETLEGELTQYRRAAAALRLLAPDDDNANGVDFELALHSELLSSETDEDGDGAVTADTAAIEAIAAKAAAAGEQGDAAAEATAADRRDSLTTQAGRLTVADLLGTDVRAVIKPALRELKATLHQRTVDSREEEAELADKAEATSEAAEDCRMRLQEASKRVQGLTETFKREKAALERSLASLIEQTDAVEAEVDRAREELQRADEEAGRVDDRAVRRARDAATRRVEAAHAQADAAAAQLRTDTLAVARHVEAVRRRLGAAAEAVERKGRLGVDQVAVMLERVTRACQEDE